MCHKYFFMKRIYFALITVLFSVLFLNCQKEFSAANFGSGNIENNLPAPITATLQGIVYDENGQPAVGVQIKVGTKNSITNDHGYFRIRDAALDKNASLVIAEKPGYFTGYRTFNATSGVNQVVIKLVKKTLSGSVDGASGGDIVFSNGSKISLPANGIIKKSDGSSYNGSVNVYAHYIDSAASDINEIVPGSFAPAFCKIQSLGIGEKIIRPEVLNDHRVLIYPSKRRTTKTPQTRSPALHC